MIPGGNLISKSITEKHQVICAISSEYLILFKVENHFNFTPIQPGFDPYRSKRQFNSSVFGFSLVL